MIRLSIFRLLAPSFATLALCACGGGEPKEPRAPTIEDRVRAAPSNSSFDVAAAAHSAVLALEVIVTDRSVTANQARFVRAALPTGTSEPEMEVSALDGDDVIHRYLVPDPLRVEDDETEAGGRHRSVRVPEERLWIYLPLSAQAAEIAPAHPSIKTGSGRIDLVPIVRQLCTGFANVRECAVKRSLDQSDQAIWTSK